MLIGTGGEMKSGGSEDARSMFWNPDAYNLRVYYIEKRGRTEPCAKFIGATRKLEGFYEKSGVSDEEGALKFLTEKRARKEKDQDAYDQERMEFCLDPDEAFMVTGGEYFNIPLLERRYSAIERSPDLQAIVKRYTLKPIKDDQGRVVDVKAEEDPDGIFEIAELPIWADPGREGPKVEPFDNLYISGCDSFDAVAEAIPDKLSRGKMKSNGSIFIFKRFWKATETGPMFVAKLKQRTENGTEFYNNTILLNLFYHSKMLYEHTKIGIAQHYITTSMHRLLLPKPRLGMVDVVKNPTSTNAFGIPMPIEIKKHAIKRYSEYIDNYIDTMYFSSQLLDAIHFKLGSPAFDETMAAAITILADDDMHAVLIEEKQQQDRHFPVFHMVNGRLVFS
jgi:hypothetical protein